MLTFRANALCLELDEIPDEGLLLEILFSTKVVSQYFDTFITY